MSNLFRIDFVQGKTDAADYGQVKHSLVDTDRNREIISLSVSADKLQSVSNYSREPKRMVFECFPDTWIQDKILSGNNEHERYISHYEVKVYRDNALFFTGIIDTSQLSFNESTEILKFTCYDKIKLLSVFSDLTHYYGITSGYLPIWILGYFLQDIEQTIPISIPYSNQFVQPVLNIPTGSMLTLAHIDYGDMATLPSGSGWQAVLHESSWTGPRSGYIVHALMNQISFVFGHYVCFDAHPASPRYRAYYRGRIYRFYNGVCPVVKEYDEDTGWIENRSYSTVEDGYAKLFAFFTDNGISEATLNSLSATCSLDGRAYGRSHLVNNWVEAKCNGNVLPAKLQPGKAYENYSDEQTDNLKVLQAMLMLYNATIISDIYGRIVLKNKDAYSSEIIAIDDSDVISMIIKRGNQETPDMETIDVLAGDTRELKEIVKAHLIDFYDSKWSIDARLSQISKYDIGLYSKIRMRDRVYAIIEVEKDIANDEIKLKAWRL